MTSLRICALALFVALFAHLAVAEDLTIPVLVGQTGASATFGRNETDAYTLAADEWNKRGGVSGKKVILQMEDTQTNALNIVSAFRRLQITKSPVVLGPTWLDGFPAVIPVARKDNVLLITPSAAREAFSDTDKSWPITFYHNSTIEIQVLLAGLKQRSLSHVALVYEQEPFAEMIRKLVIASGAKLVADIGVQAGQSDFRSQVTRLTTQKPDALIVFVWDEKSLLSLLQQLKVQLPEVPVATVHDGAGWLEAPAFKPAISRLIYTKFLLADNDFDARFKARFGYQPILTASNAYDALNSVLTAISAGAKTAEQIRTYLMGNELQTVTFGKFRFGADGSVPSKVEVEEFPSMHNQ